MKTINGNLVLKENTTFNEDLKVDGNIVCEGGLFDLNVEGNISAHNISARDISAHNISAWNISAGNISAWNISAGDISAGDISAFDISYYAVCFAYKNIKCTSIKGIREPCKEPFVLDGTIEIINKSNICEKCGQEIKK